MYARLQPLLQFYTFGIDFFGPLTIMEEVQKRVRRKCNGVTLVCFSSHAVHVNVSKDYSTDSFLQVMRPFSSIRGWSKKIYSDCGTQLVSASKELKNAGSRLDQHKLQAFCVKHKIKRNFTPGDAPWMSGVTEAFVKSIKKVLNAAVGDQ